MNPVLKAVGCAFILLFLGVILREMGFKGVRLVTLIGTVGILAACVLTIDSMGEIFEKIGQDSGEEYVVAVMKIIGVGYVSGICSDICLEFGEMSLSNAVLMFGRAEMLMICTPEIISILKRGVDLIG